MWSSLRSDGPVVNLISLVMFHPQLYVGTVTFWYHMSTCEIGQLNNLVIVTCRSKCHIGKMRKRTSCHFYPFLSKHDQMCFITSVNYTISTGKEFSWHSTKRLLRFMIMYLYM